jgi:alpha-galactosidase
LSRIIPLFLKIVDLDFLVCYNTKKALQRSKKMESRYAVNKADMSLLPDILKFTVPGEVPLHFFYGSREINGIPEDFEPTVDYRFPDCNTVQYIIEGKDKSGLSLRAEYIEYKDFPVTEWVVYITNSGSADTPIISDVRIEGKLVCPTPILERGNGDTRAPDGYEFFKDSVDKRIVLTPVSGTSCEGAFPYMTLHGADREIRAAIGWPTRWIAEISPTDGGVIFSCGQARCHTVLRPGETFRTPRLNLMVYTNEDAPFRGINLWRSWYFKHILPREDGQPIPPKLCLHYYCADGKPEFTGATEENQIHALNEYVRRGMRPDIWWIDAGWYPCDYNWTHTGTWHTDPERFPNGLAPLGRACEDNGVQLMVWFEPERVRPNTELYDTHPEWLLSRKREDGTIDNNNLLDLSNKEALGWLIEHVNSFIKESHTAIYRQDFNFDPAPFWEQNEADDRIGMTENLHGQGYLAYWDSILLNNPGLWIDSCASGGRRNDLESMRRAVPLHYTDVGYGNHPIKQKQHREMFEWIPYFRAHNMSWDNPDGSYGSANKSASEYDFHCALAPALTSMYTYDDTEENFGIGIKMDAIWREAAELELSGDYYPISECRCDPHDWYAMQFDNPKEKRGFVQVIRNTLAQSDKYALKLPCVHPECTYVFCNRESGESFSLNVNQLSLGFEIALPRRTGIVLFYQFS